MQHIKSVLALSRILAIKSLTTTSSSDKIMIIMISLRANESAAEFTAQTLIRQNCWQIGFLNVSESTQYDRQWFYAAVSIDWMRTVPVGPQETSVIMICPGLWGCYCWHSLVIFRLKALAPYCWKMKELSWLMEWMEGSFFKYDSSFKLFSRSPPVRSCLLHLLHVGDVLTIIPPTSYHNHTLTVHHRN